MGIWRFEDAPPHSKHGKKSANEALQAENFELYGFELDTGTPNRCLSK